MSDYVIATLCSHSAAIPVIAGVIRLNKVLRVYRPFLIVLVIGWLNELLSSYLIWHHRSNAVNSNVYVLVEFLLILMLFKNWDTRKKGAKVYGIAAAIVVLLWVMDNIVFSFLTEVNEVYRIIYSLLLVFLSVDQMNHVLIIERGNILANSKFIICCGFLLYYTFKAILESFLVLRLEMSHSFYSQFLFLMVGVNVFVNVIYTIAILWMPTKQSFFTRYQ